MSVLFLLGRRDFPTDGIEDYSRWLAEALTRRGHAVDVWRVAWEERGWLSALDQLRRKLRADCPAWVLIQYTPLSWSKRALPVQALAITGLTRTLGARVAVVIHDPLGFPGRRIRDRVRRVVQTAVMKGLVGVADRTFVTVAPERLSWLRRASRNRVELLPVGSNIPPVAAAQAERRACEFTVCVFGITGGPREREVKEIAAVMGRVADELGSVQLVALGRGSIEAAPLLEHALNGNRVKVVVTGVIPEDVASGWLAGSDSLLFVRGGLSSRRTTAIAAVAHGVPIVGYEGPETGWPITEAGIVLVPPGDVVGVAKALVRLANDPAWAASLRERNRSAHEQHFAWDRIAERLERALSCSS